MGKIICEICGTVYPDSADCCPICGYSREKGSFAQGDEYMEEDLEKTEGFDLDDYAGFEPEKTQEQELPQEPEMPKKGRKAIFDYDAVNPRDRKNSGSDDSYQDVEDEVTLIDYPEENYDNYGDEGNKSHVGLIIFLILLIILLISASAFLFIKFIMPNLNPNIPVESMPIVTEAPTTETTAEPTFPCESLALVEGGQVELNREGQFYLIHVVVTPENTTDSLSYASEDENIVIVDGGGKITAVGEGQTNVILTCGDQILRLPVSVKYVEETEAAEAPTEEESKAEIEETEGAEKASEETGETTTETKPSETAPEETKAETAPKEETKAEGDSTEPTLKNVELKLKKSDLMSGVQGVSFRLELDCELEPEEVQWSTSNSAVALVKDGVVTTIGPGTCTITAKYGDQEATCMIRCKF